MGTPAGNAVCFPIRLYKVGTLDLLHYETDCFLLTHLYRGEVCYMPRRACARHCIVLSLWIGPGLTSV